MFALSSLRHATYRQIIQQNSIKNNYLKKRIPFHSFTTGRKRRWGKDEIFALSTWLVVGTGAFILIGTTTSASIALLLANSLQFQEYVTDKLGKWLSASLGWKVNFGSGIVPNWRDGRITLKDVSLEFGEMDIKDQNVPDYEVDVPLSENYTRFSVQLDRLDVRISLSRWLDGRGWLEEVLIDGARGTLDKRWIRSIKGWKWIGKRGDFDLDSLKLRNVHLSIIQPKGFRPYSVTILSANIPRLRASWLFYDLMSAESAHGIFDGKSLFTLHTTDSSETTRQLKHFRMLGLDVRHLNQGTGGAFGWVTRGTVDIEGFYQFPLDSENNLISKKENGSFDFNPDTLKEKLLIPLLKRKLRSNDTNEIGSVDKVESVDSYLSPLLFWYESKLRARIPKELISLTDKIVTLPTRISDRISQRILSSLKDVDFGGLESAEEAAEHFLKAPPDSLSFQVDFLFRNLRAKLPAEELNHPRSTLLKPVIGYVNEHRPLIPLSCHFNLSRTRFEGAWSGHESGIIDNLSEGLEGAFRKLVWDPQRRMQRIGKIGRWTLKDYLKKRASDRDIL